jgi:NAD(P)-dependent dehydrogenase (short-subunit alcohol dehydrogenase family)
MLAAFALAAAAEAPIGAPCYPTAAGIDLFKDMDLTGKTALVTGSTSGIGLEIAKALAARKATVILTWRNETLCKEVAAKITASVPGAKLVVPTVPLDLASFATVRTFAKSLGSAPLDILINDAAMANNPHGLVTGDGMEMAFQVDYPSTWLLTDLLMPQVRAAKGRVVNLVSKAFRMACQMSERSNCLELDRLPPPVIPGLNKTVPLLGIPPTNYGIAKLLIIRWTEDLARRELHAGTGVSAFSVDPGFVNTSMAGADNMSPFWKKLACSTEGRDGAPCPTTGPQGSLTPVFLAIAPAEFLDLANATGKYFEWCAATPVQRCSTDDTVCQLGKQSDQALLWNQTAKWLVNFTDPSNPPNPEPPAPVAACPKVLGPLCKLFNETQCFSQCSVQADACTADPACKKSLISTMECIVSQSAQGKMAAAGLACLIPDNLERDKVFKCMMDEHSCIPSPPGPTYPACRDTEIPGDPTFTSLSDLEGHWWKVRGWSAGEPYECRPCGRVAWSPSPTPNALTINSSWLEKDIHGKQWNTTDSSLFGIRADGKGFPQKLAHTGDMLGLGYVENFTVVHDGRHEQEPYLFLYGCGATKQGAYTTGFAIAQTPTASDALAAKILAVAAKAGFNTSDFCVVDNSCVADRA